MPTKGKIPNVPHPEEDDYVSPEELREEADKIEAGELPVPEGKDPVRVVAGLKAAATRKERHRFPVPGDEKPISQGGQRDTSRDELTRKK